MIMSTPTTDECWFTDAYNCYSEKMYSLAFRLIRREDIARDTVHEVFAALWKKRRGIEVVNLEHYLLQSVRFHACKVHRHQKVKRVYMNSAVFLGNDLQFSDPGILWDMKKAIGRTFSAMPEDQRLIFSLNREHALTYPRIAERLGISVKTVEKKMSRSLKSFREQPQMI
jgi:RNA polymerase sigma factor (sigma-70 family)